MKLQGKVLGNKLEDWVQYTYKIENEGVSDCMRMLRGFIEREEKIQKEIQMDYVKVITSYKTLNFFTPAPIILPAKEQLLFSRFTISQLYQLIAELRTLSTSDFFLESKSLVQYFFRKTCNVVSEFCLPLDWKTHTLRHYQNLVCILDSESGGLVDGRSLCVYLCLLGCKIMGKEEEEDYRSALKFGTERQTIDYNDFVNTPCWIDEFEGGNNEENANYFNREKHLKSIIFSVFCDENVFFDFFKNF